MSVNNFTFAGWQVTPTKNLLLKNGAEARLEPKVMQLLTCLARANGELVSRDELMDELWPRLVVGDVLNNTVALLRKALGDTNAPRRYIETIPKQGYRLIPTVSWENPAAETTQSSSQFSSSGDGVSTVNPNTETPLSARPALVIMAILSVFFITSFYFQFWQTTPDESVSVDSQKLKTLAVLPFDTYSEKSDIKFFTDGLVEELIHQLAANPDFRVIARTSSESFKGSNTDIVEISRVLGARYIMEGSVRQSGEVLRVTVQLNDADNGFHIWSRTFDHQKDDNVLDTQIAIGQKVTTLISSNKPAATVYQNRTHPSSAEAYKLFLIGQSHLKFVEVDHLEKALEYFQRSLEIAPDYALAYTGIAAAQLLLYQYSHTPLVEAMQLSTDALNKALSLEPDLAEAYAVRGLQETYSLQYGAAEEDFKKAIELNPGLRFARHNYGFMLWSLSRPSEALEQFEIALEMDPLSTITNFAVGDVLGNLGRFDQAITHYLQCQELLPEDYGCFLGLANIYKLTGDFNLYSDFLNLASQRVGPDNFWLTIANALDALLTDDLARSSTLLAEAATKSPTNGYLQRTAFMLNLRSSTLADYSNNIKQLIIESPNVSDMNLLLGLSSYFEGNCKLAMSHYERARKDNANAMIEVWDFSIGISHLLNLAHCYQLTDRQNEAARLMLDYREFIQSLPVAAHTIPGVIYNAARYATLDGKPEDAELLLEQIADWPFIWMIELDPIWQID